MRMAFILAVASVVPERIMMRDPVCGMMVDERKTNLKSEYEGRTFYFCSPNCKKTFDSDPRRYGHPK